MTPTLDQARAARRRLARSLAAKRNVNGVGIVQDSNGYGLKINLIEPADDEDFPPEVDGVQVRVDVVGPASPA